MDKKTTYLLRIVTVICLIGLFLYLLVHLTYSFRDELSHTKQIFTGYYGEEEDMIDVVILGTSTTFSAYMPMKLWEDYGISAYDFCTNVQFEESMPYSINEILKTQSPEVLIIDMSPFLYGHTCHTGSPDEATLRYNTDGYRWSVNRIKLINELIPDVKDRLYYYFDLLYYHENRHPDFSAWNYKSHSVSKGYNNLYIDVAFSPDEERAATDDIMELSDNDVSNLDTLMARLDDYSGEVLFAIVPYFNIDNEKKVHERANYLRKYISEKGYPIIDFYSVRDEVGIDVTKDYSLDYLHFNVESAEKITGYLGKYLVNNYTMTDHREDAGYKQWSEDYEEWKGILKEERENTIQSREKFLTENKEGE